MQDSVICNKCLCQGHEAKELAAASCRVWQYALQVCLPWFELQEWFKFVDHEKTLRVEIEDDFAALVEEVSSFKVNTINQV